MSGHRLVEWVQRYACAKFSETTRLAGGWAFHGGDQDSFTVSSEHRSVHHKSFRLNTWTRGCYTAFCIINTSG
jgi:hypothetical protein